MDPGFRTAAALGFGGSPKDRGETSGLGLGLAELELRAGIRACGGAGARASGPLSTRLHLQGGRGRQHPVVAGFLYGRNSGSTLRTREGAGSLQKGWVGMKLAMRAF